MTRKFEPRHDGGSADERVEQESAIFRRVGNISARGVTFSRAAQTLRARQMCSARLQGFYVYYNVPSDSLGTLPTPRGPRAGGNPPTKDLRGDCEAIRFS